MQAGVPGASELTQLAACTHLEDVRLWYGSNDSKHPSKLLRGLPHIAASCRQLKRLHVTAGVQPEHERRSSTAAELLEQLRGLDRLEQVGAPCLAGPPANHRCHHHCRHRCHWQGLE